MDPNIFRLSGLVSVVVGGWASEEQNRDRGRIESSLSHQPRKDVAVGGPQREVPDLRGLGVVGPWFLVWLKVRHH